MMQCMLHPLHSVSSLLEIFGVVLLTVLGRAKSCALREHGNFPVLEDEHLKIQVQEGSLALP